MTFDIDI